MDHNPSPQPDRPPASPPQEGPALALDKLRRQIDEIDEQVVSLLARRYEHVKNLTAIKKAAGLPVYHPAREEDLISHRRAQASQAGLDPDFIEELYRSIVRQSRVRQTKQVARSGVRAGHKVLLVGGRGRMGSYLGRWFGEAGYEVRILDIDDWPQVTELCRGIHLVLIAVPIDRTVEVIQQIGPYLPVDCVLTDITSLKQAPLAAMLNVHAGPVVGLHPLFGPATSSMDQQVVVASPGRHAAACQWLLEQLAAWGSIVLTLSAQEHDRLMDLIQGVRHFATFAFGRFLARHQVNLGRTLEFSSPIYRLELGMVGRLFAQDPGLYASIILASPERKALLREYVRALGQTLQLLEEGGPEGFCQEFQQIARWFGPFCEQAMRESSFLIEKLVERF